MTDLITALPLIRGIDNQLQFLAKQFMTDVHVWTKQMFGSADYSYIKDDLASLQRASVKTYAIRSGKNSFAGRQTGIIRMELHFNLKNFRDNLAQNVIQIANIIQLISLNEEFTFYMQPFMPGLFWFGKKCEVDYKKVYSKESIVTIDFDYCVDLVGYQYGLQQLGCDITSPDSPIYPDVTELLENIEVLNSEQETEFVVN